MLEPAHIALRLAHSTRLLVMRGSGVEIRYIESKLQKGNIYTKARVPAQFSAEAASHQDAETQQPQQQLKLIT